MKGRAIIRLVAGNQADADAIRDDVLAWLQARADRWPTEGTEPVSRLTHGQWLVIADCCFTARIGADALLARITQRWTSGPISSRILAGSWVRLHDCSHDVGVGFCTWDVEAVK